MKRKELIIISLISLIIVTGGLFQTLVYVVKTPSGFHYPLVHNYEQDYYWYLSLMRQGYEGFLLVTSRYTPEQFAPQFINTFFPVTGMIARIVGLSLPVMYTVLRVLGGAGLLVTGYMLLMFLRAPKWQKIIAFIFMVTGAPFWFWDNGILRQAGEFWTGFDPVLRIAWLPHHTMANTLMIGAMILFAEGLSDKLLKSLGLLKLFIVSGIIIAAAGWLNPASLITFALAAAAALVICFFQNGTKGIIGINAIKGMILFLTAPIIVIVLLYRVQNSVFPWTAFHDWERFVQYPVDARGYLATLGFVGVIGGIGIIRAIKRKSLWWDMIIGWYLVPFIGLSITGLPVSNGRFLQSAGYIPAAILASEAIMMFREKLTSYGKPGKYLAVTIVILVIILQVPAFISSFGRQMMYVGKNMTNPLVYIPDDIRNGLTYLGYDCNGRVIAAPSGISTLIPAFSSCRVLAGHPTFTYNGADKMTDLSAIFSSVSPERIESIADKYGVMLIWVPTGALPDINFDKMDFMPDYTNSGVVIYRRIIR